MFEADQAEMAAQESVAAEIHRAAMLMKCPACRRECSVNAVACPGCAEPFRKAEELKPQTLAEAVAVSPYHAQTGKRTTKAKTFCVTCCVIGVSCILASALLRQETDKDKDRAGTLLFMGIAAIGIMVWAAPVLIAYDRGHPHREAITALTVLAPTVICWVVAIVWSLMAPAPPRTPRF